MLAKLLFLLLLTCHASSMPMSTKETTRPALQDAQQSSARLPPYFQDTLRKRESQRKNRERRTLLGQPINGKIAEEHRLRRMPDYMREMSEYQRNKERKRMLGLRPSDDIPQEYFNVANQILVNAELARIKDDSLSIPASIDLAQKNFNEEKMVVQLKGHEKATERAESPTKVSSEKNYWPVFLPARQRAPSASVITSTNEVATIPLTQEHGGNAKKAAATIDLNLPPPDEDM